MMIIIIFVALWNGGLSNVVKRAQLSAENTELLMVLHGNKDIVKRDYAVLINGFRGFQLVDPANTGQVNAIFPFHESPPLGEDVVEC